VKEVLGLGAGQEAPNAVAAGRLTEDRHAAWTPPKAAILSLTQRKEAI
jgi:hypothetical protein